MDIEKEREAFEEKFNHLDLSFVDDLGYCEIETQTAWEAWQAAKAQAVPDGFVVVPKEPTQEMNKAGLQEYRKVIGVGQDDIGYIYKAMIEAREQAND